MNESLLNIDKDRIIKPDYQSKLTIRQKTHFKEHWKVKRMDAFKHIEGTQYKSQKFN